MSHDINLVLKSIPCFCNVLHTPRRWACMSMRWTLHTMIMDLCIIMTLCHRECNNDITHAANDVA